MLACNYMGDYEGGFIHEIGVAFNTDVYLLVHIRLGRSLGCSFKHTILNYIG